MRSREYQALKAYLLKSWQPAHRLAIQFLGIYEVYVKPGAPNPYKDWIESKSPDALLVEERRLVWHGTPRASLLGILDRGLQIRQKGADITGGMFGEAIYFADAASKGVRYCRPHQAHGEVVLLLCEADIGRKRKVTTQNIEAVDRLTELALGHWRSIEGRGRTQPCGWVPIDWQLAGEPRGGQVLIVRIPLICELMGYRS